MGVVYKLKPEVIEFIVEKKKFDKTLSCRKITGLIYDKFKVKLSKSSANYILKQAGLSMPVGRRPKLKRAPSDESVVSASVRCIKVSLLDGSSFYLDGQLHTVWRSAQIPDDFSSPIYNIKSYIEGIFNKNLPFVLFFASGYETPTEECFEFILSFAFPEKRISQLILYNNKLEELEKINIGHYEKRHFIFGVWPWQFREYIKVRIAGEFVSFHFDPLKKDFYIARAEVELLPPKKDAVAKLSGCALKTGLDKNVCLIILSNFTLQEINLTELATLYLSHWPNLEETLQDFSRKIEQFRKRFLKMRK